MKKHILVAFIFILSGCGNWSDKLIFGYELFRSNVPIHSCDADENIGCVEPVYKNNHVVVFVSTKGKYRQYAIDEWNLLPRMKAVYYENSSEMVDKLLLFIEWANLPLDQRIERKSEFESKLPNNDVKSNKVTTTDFFLYMDNENTPYLAFAKNLGFISGHKYYLIDASGAKKMIVDILIWKQQAAEQINKK